MKTKEQILKHLVEVGYTDKAIAQICAYLIGAGVKKRAEVLKIRKGYAVFDDFLEWNKDIRFRKGDCVYLHSYSIIYCAEDYFSDSKIIKGYNLKGMVCDYYLTKDSRIATDNERMFEDVALAETGLYFNEKTLRVEKLHEHYNNDNR